jgi:hypothetical protein
MRKIFGWLAAASSVAATVVAGCQLVGGISDELVVGGDGDGGVGPGEDAGCQHAAVPRPPSPDAGGPFGDETFVVALREILLKKAADGSDLGLDLDRYCTCQGETPSCIPPKGQPEQFACDLAAGRDNRTPTLFALIETIYQVEDLSPLYTQFAEQGNWSLLLRVSDYNGEPNDNQVRVDWFSSARSNSLPSWDGSDLWPVLESSVLNGSIDQPRTFDPGGYVTNGVLVFSVPEGRLDIAGPVTRMSIPLTGGSVMARIEKNPGGGYALRDGTIAGRISLADLFNMIGSFRDENGQPFCTDEAFWGATKDSLCRGVDIQTDFAEPNKPCNAVSFAAGFSAVAAQLGLVQPWGPPTAPCSPETDPLLDYMLVGCPP